MRIWSFLFCSAWLSQKHLYISLCDRNQAIKKSYGCVWSEGLAWDWLTPKRLLASLSHWYRQTWITMVIRCKNVAFNFEKYSKCCLWFWRNFRANFCISSQCLKAITSYFRYSARVVRVWKSSPVSMRRRILFRWRRSGGERDRYDHLWLDAGLVYCWMDSASAMFSSSLPRAYGCRAQLLLSDKQIFRFRRFDNLLVRCRVCFSQTFEQKLWSSSLFFVCTAPSVWTSNNRFCRKMTAVAKNTKESFQI